MKSSPREIHAGDMFMNPDAPSLIEEAADAALRLQEARKDRRIRCIEMATSLVNDAGSVYTRSASSVVEVAEHLELYVEGSAD